MTQLIHPDAIVLGANRGSLEIINTLLNAGNAMAIMGTYAEPTFFILGVGVILVLLGLFFVVTGNRKKTILTST